MSKWKMAVAFALCGVLAFVAVSAARAADRICVYPRSFERGGWSLDAQFMDVMGSPYLLAHGLGVRVLDAKARVVFPKLGEYRIWVRSKNWADGNPGRFRVLVDGKPLGKTFGAGSREWSWEDVRDDVEQLYRLMLKLSRDRQHRIMEDAQ